MMEYHRQSKEQYYMDIAKAVSQRSTCLRKHWGCVIVKNDEIISTGYNGAPRGRKNCVDVGSCYRIDHNIKRGTNYETCRSVHAEQNAIISACRKDMLYSTMYVYGYDMETHDIVKNAAQCTLCRRMTINAGIDEVIMIKDIIAIEDNKYFYQFKVIKVDEYLKDDESLSDDMGY